MNTWLVPWQLFRPPDFVAWNLCRCWLYSRSGWVFAVRLYSSKNLNKPVWAPAVVQWHQLPSAVCDLWDPMGSHCQTAKSRKSDIQHPAEHCYGMRIPFRSQTDFRILVSQIGVLTDLLLCGWDLSTSQAAYTAVAGSSSSQLYSSRSPVVLYKIFSNPFSFIRRSSFMKLNIEIKHLQTWISRSTQHDFRN